MKDLRIVFMGTPDFAVGSLTAILKANYNVVGVITAPDKPAGRGRKIHESAVKKFAKDNGLNLLQPTNLKHPDFIEELKLLKADLQVVVAFRMLPKIIWSMPSCGTFNLHASLLPDYRGAAPIHWAIINGENKSGVTTFFINENIDTGAIIMQEQVDIDGDMNTGKLHDLLMSKGAALVVKTIEHIIGNTITTIKQPEADLKPAPKLNKDNCRIDWTLDLHHIKNKVRGLDPFPSAWTIIDNCGTPIETKINRVNIINETHELEVGQIVTTKKEIKVAVKHGFINILELKLAGKKKMDAISLLNGFEFCNEAKML